MKVLMFISLMVAMLGMLVSALGERYVSLRGLGTAVIDEIGGSDTYDEYSVTLKPYTPYIIVLTGLGRGDLDLYLIDRLTGAIVKRSTSFGDGEVITLETGFATDYVVKVKVSSGYSYKVDPGYVLAILPKPVTISQRG